MAHLNASLLGVYWVPPWKRIVLTRQAWLPCQQLKCQEGEFALKLAKRHKLHQTTFCGTCLMNHTDILVISIIPGVCWGDAIFSSQFVYNHYHAFLWCHWLRKWLRTCFFVSNNFATLILLDWITGRVYLLSITEGCTLGHTYIQVVRLEHQCSCCRGPIRLILCYYLYFFAEM